MVDRRQKIELEVEKTMTSLDQTPRLSAGPWFTSQVKRRFEAENSPAAATGPGFKLWFLRPALLVLVVTLNLVTAVMAIQRSNPSDELRDTYVSNFATEYAYTDSDTLFTLDE